MHHRRLMAPLAALSFVLASTMWAQVNTGSIGGTVLDPAGASVPGAVVIATDQAAGRTYTSRSSEAGVYVFASLPTGVYDVTAESPGFKKLSRTGLEVRVAQRLSLDLSLEVGEVTETVEVRATAPLLESTTSERGQSFSVQFMNTLPLFTGGIRNPSSFVRFMPASPKAAATSRSTDPAAARRK